MQIKVLALFVAQAAAMALPGEPILHEDIGAIEEPTVAIEKRYPPDYCHADNCLRNLRDSRFSSSATGFCATWLRVTSTETVYDILTTSETSTSTPEVETITTSVPTGTATVTEYYIAPDNRYKKRQATSDYPPWLSTSCNLSRVTSACSCYAKENSISPLTVWDTTTITTSTEVVSFTTTLPTVTETSTEEYEAVKTEEVGIKCGIKGCARLLLIKNTSIFVSSLASCKAKCLNRPTCKSFHYVPALDICNIGDVLPDTFYSPYSSGFPYVCGSTKIYDRNCIV